MRDFVRAFDDAAYRLDISVGGRRREPGREVTADRTDYESIDAAHGRTMTHEFLGTYVRLNIAGEVRKVESQWFLNRNHFHTKLAQWNAQQPGRWQYWQTEAPSSG